MEQKDTYLETSPKRGLDSLRHTKNYTTATRHYTTVIYLSQRSCIGNQYLVARTDVLGVGPYCNNPSGRDRVSEGPRTSVEENEK